jgi:glycosyltransferase involved in cell wall biosynthesis
MSEKIKVCHFTSVHTRYDVRIFLKQCKSLERSGLFEVHQVVADGMGDELNSGVHIHDVGPKTSRFKRMFITSKKVYEKAIDLDCEIYHFHDPELFPYGKKLKRKGKKVVFDAHEDLPKQLLSKPYFHPFVGKVVAKIMGRYEKIICSKLDGVLTATPYINDKFLKINKNALNVNNFPILDELNLDGDWSEKKREVCYVGGISRIRGVQNLVDAVEKVEDVRFNLAGNLEGNELEEELKLKVGWNKTEAYGQVGRAEVAQILKRSMAGLVTFFPVPNHIDAQPNKMFEYMSAGIPIITSNFPLWKLIVNGNECGICVDPESTKEISGAISRLTNNPDLAKKMGENGRKAVCEKYNWGIEELKLVQFYKDLLK